MLSESWDEKQDDAGLHKNLQRDLARIMLSLANIPLPRIGSFRLENEGYLRLDNRPITILFAMHENEGIPLGISRDTTFSRANDFVGAHLEAFNNRLLYQPNAIDDHDDAWFQMTSLIAAKATFPQLFRRDLDNGQFVFAFTDLHASNIFVDEDWNVTCIIDLEFACSLPIEFLHPPSWLGAKLVDEIEPAAFAPKHAGCVEHIRHHEQLKDHKKTAAEPLSSVMQQAWTNGAFWATLSLRDPIGFTHIVYDRVLPDFFSITRDEMRDFDHQVFARMWGRNISNIVDRKVEDRNRYLERLRAVFTDATCGSSEPTP